MREIHNSGDSSLPSWSPPTSFYIKMAEYLVIYAKIVK